MGRKLLIAIVGVIIVSVGYMFFSLRAQRTNYSFPTNISVEVTPTPSSAPTPVPTVIPGGIDTDPFESHSVAKPGQLIKIETAEEALIQWRSQYLISPEGKYLAGVTSREQGSTVHIEDVQKGKTITRERCGYFQGWSSDGSKIILYLSDMDCIDGEKIYYLDLDDNYYDSGLPRGSTGADIFSIDGSIVYTLTTVPGTNKMDMYIRDQQKNDKLLLSGGGHLFAWMRWSPKGDKIAFLRSDLYISGGQQYIWVINSDGTGLVQISAVDWGRPPMWSPDGSKITFTHAGYIWEYNIDN